MDYLNTFEVKNEKLYKLLLDKKEIINAGRKANEKLEPLVKKMKPLQEELQELERKLKVKEEKMTPLATECFEEFKEKIGEFEDIMMFQAGKKEGIIEFKTVDIVADAKQRFLAAKKKRDESMAVKPRKEDKK